MSARVLCWLGLVMLLTACQPNAPSPYTTPAQDAPGPLAPSLTSPVAAAPATPSPAAPSPAAPSPATASPAATSPAMTRVPAGRGETCSQYVRWCVEWCTKNMPGASGCLASCQKRGETCLENGEWVVETESKIVTRLPKR